MKTILKWYKWILLAIIFQFCVLLYINNVFLNTDVEVSVTNANLKNNPSTGNFKIAEGAQQISMSFNAKFGAYLLDGVLHIVNVDNNKDKKIAGTGNDKITYYRWLPDRDMVIYSSNSKDGKKGIVQISTYEADSETLRDYPEIAGLPSKSEVMEIELSPYTNVVYGQIRTSDTNSKIIRFNVMSQYASIMTIGANSIIKECTYVNKLIYQNKGEAAYVYDGMTGSKNKIPLSIKNYCVLGIDLEDTLYIGELDDSGKVIQLYHQQITDQKLNTDWTIVPVKEDVLPEEIIVSGSGNIYRDIVEESKIVNLLNDRKASYRGDFIEVLNGALVSKDENKVYVTSLKEY